MDDILMICMNCRWVKCYGDHQLNLTERQSEYNPTVHYQKVLIVLPNLRSIMVCFV